MKQLLEKNERIRFYLIEEDKLEFVKEVNDLHITFIDGNPLTINNCGLLMAITNKKLAYVSAFIWNASFHTNQLNPLRIH